MYSSLSIYDELGRQNRREHWNPSPMYNIYLVPST
jgi:hypothetical protein